jgi:predicted Zn-dependent peptidase
MPRLTGLQKKARLLCTLVAVCVVATSGGCGGGPDEIITYERRVLANGVTVIVQNVPNLNRLGVETFYKTGFMHDVGGNPGVAHLAEHLIAKSATEKYRAGQAWDTIVSRGGVTNAETLPHFTHFDYSIPLTDLGIVVSIEKDRMTTLRLEQEVAEGEMERCYAELRTVENQPTAPVVKFAAMAANQAWRFGKEQAELGSGLGAIAPQSLRNYIKARYGPERFIFVVTGTVEPASTIDYIDKHLGEVPSSGSPDLAPIEWSSIPEQTTIKWDSKINGVFVWFAPPADATDRIVLSLWANAFGERLARDHRVTQVASFAMCSSYTWPVGELPFFAYISLRPGIAPETGRQTLEDRVRQIVSEFEEAANPTPIQLLANDFGNFDTLTREQVVSQSLFLRNERKMSDIQALEQTLLAHSLNLGIREMMFGESMEQHLERIEALKPADLVTLISRELAPEKMRSTVLVGTEADAAQ